MGAVKQALLEELDAENRQQEKEKAAAAAALADEEQYLLEDKLERQHEEDLIENSIQDQIEEDYEQAQIEEKYECKLHGEPYFRPRIMTLKTPLIAKGADIK